MKFHSIARWKKFGGGRHEQRLLFVKTSVEILFRLNWMYMQSCLNLSPIKSTHELSHCVCVRSLSELEGDVTQLYVSCVGYSGVLFVYAGQQSHSVV